MKESAARVFQGRSIPEEYRTGALHGDRYSSREYAQREFDRVFARSWLVTGRDTEIPEPGDYYTFTIGPESILVVRQHDGSVRAFYNVCQHRGNRLVQANWGSQPSFTCQYHGWRWNIDGSLEWVQDEDNFPNGSPCGKLTLNEVKCEVFKSFVFINMNTESSTLREFLGPVWDDWQVYPVEKMVRTQAMTVKLPSNWKAFMDNITEAYHFSSLHPTFLDMVEDDHRTLKCDVFIEGHTRQVLQVGRPAQRYIERADTPISPRLAAELRRWELKPDSFVNHPADTRTAIQEAKRRIGAERGWLHYEQMSDSQLTDAHFYTVFPNFAISMMSDGALFHRLRPHPDDPSVCYYDLHYYSLSGDTMQSVAMQSLQKSKGEGAGQHSDAKDVPVEEFEMGERSLGELLDGDTAITRSQQSGLRSRGFKGGHLSNQEFRVAFFHYMVDQYMEHER